MSAIKKKKKSLIFKEILRCKKKKTQVIYFVFVCVCVYIFKPLITADFLLLYFC